MNKLLLKMQPHITVLTHISSDVSQPALYLTAKNGQKYLIGRFGEGFQRSIGETKTKTSKLSGVFLTGKYKWSSVSGVPGMLLSFGDRELGLTKLGVGPGQPLERAQKMIESWSNFTFHRPINVEVDSSTYSDDNVELKPLTIVDSCSYMVKMKPVRGKFSVARARELGVPPGIMFGQLSNGETVTLSSGREVHPHEVLGPSPIPAAALVLDLPGQNYVNKAIEMSSSILDDIEECSELRAVYYFFNEQVELESSAVAKLIEVLGGSNCRHFISHPSTSPDFNTMNTLSQLQDSFRSEFPAHFSTLYSWPAAQGLPSHLNADVVTQNHIYSLEARHVDESSNKKKMKLEIHGTDSPAPQSEGLSFVPCSSLEEPEIFTLGTGASAPSKYRNVSSTLVRTCHGSIFFDCGEGTFNTLSRVFGPENRGKILSEVKLLYISHMHADHHLGGLHILLSWIDQAKSQNLPRLLVASPIWFQTFVREWAKLDDFQSDLDQYIEFLDLETVCYGKRYTSKKFHTEPLDLEPDNRGIKIVTCKAIHCPYSYNCAVTLTGSKAGDKGVKISYSGDSRPNKFFAETIGKKSELLIHEATHENELQEEALKKNHSTIGEALQISEAMGAENTILTHISQRYPRLPAVDNSSTKDKTGHVCFAFDCMHTKLSQIKELQQLVSKMGALFLSLEESTASDKEE